MECVCIHDNQTIFCQICNMEEVKELSDTAQYEADESLNRTHIETDNENHIFMHETGGGLQDARQEDTKLALDNLREVTYNIRKS